MRTLRSVLVGLVALAACSRPPPSAYLSVQSTALQSRPGIALGKNASGETCRQLPGESADEVVIYCGAWQQPAAHVRRGAVGAPSTLTQIASAGPWRAALNARFLCAAPTASQILHGDPVVLLRCKRRIGGWPQVAVVASVNGNIYLADGILPTLPVIERSIGILSGLIAGAKAANLPTSAADSLMANQLAARAFGADDVGHYEALMALGARSNLAENFSAAETAYRAALALQQHALGASSPDTVGPLMHLALQLSDQGRFSEADILFRRAEKLVRGASDRVATARLLHYRALDALNRKDVQRALTLLKEAETEYTKFIPPENLYAAGRSFSPVGGQLVADVVSLADPTAQSALMGLIEVRRYEAIALRLLNRTAESSAIMRATQELARANGMVLPLVSARLSRTAAVIAGAEGATGLAEADLARSRSDFAEVLPQTRPIAETELLRAKELEQQGQTDRVLELCRSAAALLRQIRSGTKPDLVLPCLAAFSEAAKRGSPSVQQALLREMFEISELAQNSLTIREIAEAATRLSFGSHNPKVAEAIRRRQDAGERLAELYQQRDAALHPNVASGLPTRTSTVPIAELDKKITVAQSDLADAESALEAAAPNYGQLVQEVVPADAVLNALAPDEAFVGLFLADHDGWVFLLRNGGVTARPIHGGAREMAKLVQNVRRSIEPNTQGLPAFDIRDARAIYDDTLGQVGQELHGSKALVVAPSGPLLSIPFGLLLTGPADNANLANAPWLIREMPISHVPAAANFVSLRKVGRSDANHPWFGFGDFAPVSLAQAQRTFPGEACAESAKLFASLPPLPFAQRELAAARELLGGAPKDEIIGKAFTAEAVMRTSLQNYRIIHFATHALLPAELRCQPQPAIITSAPQGAKDASGALLTASDVMGLHLNANAVVLSACNTAGPGGQAAGESLSGLARAFFFAGARSLLVTHWSINDQTSAFLVVDTLRRLPSNAGQGSLAKALREAQLGMIDAAGKSLPAAVAHPFFWAPFALIGDGGGFHSDHLPTPSAAVSNRGSAG